MFIVCITGSIYVFNEEISWWLHPEKRIAVQNRPVLMPSLLCASVIRQFPEKEPSYAYYQQGTAVNLVLKNPLSKGRANDVTVLVNPYNGQIIKMEIITKEDLKQLKNEMLAEIRQLIKPEDRQSKQWLKSAEVHKLLNISPGTLQNLRINGTLRFTKIGGMMYYKLEDINRLLEGGNR